MSSRRLDARCRPYHTGWAWAGTKSPPFWRDVVDWLACGLPKFMGFVDGIARLRGGESFRASLGCVARGGDEDEEGTKVPTNLY